MQSSQPSEAQRYRDAARQTRLDAERSSNPTIRRQLLEIAAQYDALAEAAPPSGARPSH
jgi:hypothetical protein